MGKTTLAKAVLDDQDFQGRYFNWDFDEDRRAIVEKKWTRGDKLLIFDELHKYPKWKSWIKGIYDVSGKDHSFLVTGSARLDLYKRGGDSLIGRYHYWRLHPFTLDEIPRGISPKNAFHRLMKVGGFPEPFLDFDERSARRWRKERFDRIIREDIRDLESIKNIQYLNLLLDMLKERVGNLITISNIARDLEVSSKTIKHWLEILERMYLLFSVRPYTTKLPRAVLKPPKVYFYDNADVNGEEGLRFENFVAATLLKRIHFWEDKEGFRYELRFIRDKEGREVDFAIIKDGKVDELIEVKYSDESPSRSLIYYAEKLKPKRVIQLVANLKHPYDKGKLMILDPLSYVKRFPLK